MDDLQLRSRRYHRGTSNNKKWLSRFNWLLFIVQMVLIAYVLFIAISNRLLLFNKTTYILLAIIGVTVLIQLILLVLKKLKIVVLILLLVSNSVLGFAVVKSTEVINLFNTFSRTQNISEVAMSVVVLKDSPITSLDQLKGKVVQAPLSMDKDNITALTNDIQTETKQTLTLTEVESYYTAYLNLLAGKTDAIVLNNAFESVIKSQFPDLNDKIRRVYEFKKQEVVQLPRRATTNQKTDVFNVYLSGIDTYGAITEESRSDVNIIMTVNTKTKQILLSTTPRDAFVPIADGGRNQRDKLTHAGVYGVDTSMHTLENLYDIHMDYFVRINFTTFMQMVDIVGGVTVDNAYAFQSTTVPDVYIPAGKQTLNAYNALAYVRERYNLDDGDVGRAAHQQEVITALFKKLLSPVLLTNSGQIINQLANSAQTNMKLETISTILNNYLESGSDPGYTIHSQALNVEGEIRTDSYAMPGYELWMGIVDEDSLETVKENIKRVEQGKEPIIQQQNLDTKQGE
ncbi:LCP family protein [Carnobacteriaceae bacterium zg-ZUI252]|nr:LCP family protein [Carnobacteriaceae bacterium zg-ZUI252]